MSVGHFDEQKSQLPYQGARKAVVNMLMVLTLMGGEGQILKEQVNERSGKRTLAYRGNQSCGGFEASHFTQNERV